MRWIPAGACLALAACASPVPVATPGGPAGSPTPAAAAATASPGRCTGSNPFAGVYHPYRLQVLDACRTAAGHVLALIHESDGDHHIWLALDAGYGSLLNTENHYRGRPALVVEIVPACAGPPPDATAAASCPKSPLPEPKEGEHIEVWGPWVIDLNHGWREIHPVEGILPLS